MKNKLYIFGKLLDLAKCIGNIEEALMYDSGYISIKGTCSNRKTFSLSLSEEEKEEARE